jgi:hypothetical protein
VLEVNTTGFATTAGVHLVYNSATGALNWDVNGAGANFGGGGGTIARIGTGLSLTASDFEIIA